ncbi:hypothetical protein [Acidovorax sp. NCPPB 4044]|uniref:hypothetical protein n=1 Tax=Acidovorax sp. NCPPB 4044 TaxID=2940490 RepID=UPI002303F724|nr:hypothetical protein [Acidovorax sp. NCPPB 4044]MDA8521965.1 hypothetical protein [Acidovorax sp. NCPPB 4044]
MEIARKTGAAISTVVKQRTEVGMPSTAPRARRSDAGIPQPRSIPLGKAAQPFATAAAKASPRAGRGPENVHAVDWVLVSPAGERHEVRNLYDFVRSNPSLFSDADVTWKRTGGKRGTGGEWCNATAGILNIKGGRAKSWKGWTLA